MSEVERAYENLLTGGNHLASVLVTRLGAGREHFPAYTEDVDATLKRLPSTELRDLWLCWAMLMRYRDAKEPRSKSP